MGCAVVTQASILFIVSTKEAIGCQPVEGLPECSVDVERVVFIGNVVCQGIYNTAECNFDEGDCDLFNSYPDCIIGGPLPVVGNGTSCNQGFNTVKCGFDGGDCVSPLLLPTPPPVFNMPP